MLFHTDLAYQLAGERRHELERLAAAHRLLAGMRRRDRRHAANHPALVNVVGLPPPRAGRDHTGHDQRVA